MFQEMHKQLKAASRIISNLKSRIEDLTKRNDQLTFEITSLEKTGKDQLKVHREKSQSLTDQIEKLTSELSKTRDEISTVHQQEETSGIDANKKIRLAQDQMAKVMAKDRRELQEWISKCNALEQRIATCKVLLPSNIKAQCKTERLCRKNSP